MSRGRDKAISLKFVFFILAVVIGIFCYATSTDETKTINKTKTFSEQLEYNKPKNHMTLEDAQHIAIQNEKMLQEKFQPKQVTKNVQKTNSTVSIHEQINNKFNTDATTVGANTSSYSGINTYDEKFDNLLAELEQYPPKNLTSVESIINKILAYKGYPSNIIKIVTEERDQLKETTQGSYLAAAFNIQTGCVQINKAALYGLRIQDTVALLAHELDHFDKIAKVCKSMGYENFIKLLNENKMTNVNASFWEKASQKASLKDFNSDYYKQALLRFLGQGQIDLASTYADLYRLSENMRNPLELSAYEVSDYVYDFYGIKKQEGPMQKLITKFNGVDWAIYNLVAKNNILSNQRISLFDYFFMQAILEKHPKYREIYKQCISAKNGDLTSFWLAFEKDNNSFYTKNSQIDAATYANIMSLLDKTEENAKRGLNDTVVLNALKYKVNTLLNNIVYPNAVKNIKEAATDYILYAKKSGKKDSKDELKMILTLICIENELTKNSTAQIPSLYYIKIPKVLSEEYGSINKKKYNFIYDNEAFKNEFNERKVVNSSLTEQKLLADMIYENRLHIKF